MKKIEITPGWILGKLTIAIIWSKKNVIFQCELREYPWVKLAADSLGADYTEEDNMPRFVEEHGTRRDDPLIEFTFKAKDIEENCPILWRDKR